MVLQTAARQGKLESDPAKRKFEWWYPKIEGENELELNNWAKRHGYTTRDQQLFEHLNIITRKAEKKLKKEKFNQFTRTVTAAYKKSGLAFGAHLPQDYIVPQIVVDFIDAMYLGVQSLREGLDPTIFK